MKESSTYQAILQEGRVEGRVEGQILEARKLLRVLGEDAFGSPDDRIAARIERLDDLKRLEYLLKRVRSAGSWRELFRPPTRGGRRRQSS